MTVPLSLTPRLERSCEFLFQRCSQGSKEARIVLASHEREEKDVTIARILALFWSVVRLLLQRSRKTHTRIMHIIPILYNAMPYVE